MEQPTRPDINHMMLTPVVRAAMERGRAEVVDWQVIPVTQGRASAAGVYRITGSAVEQEETFASESFSSGKIYRFGRSHGDGRSAQWLRVLHQHEVITIGPRLHSR